MRSLVTLTCLAAVLAFAGGASADGWVDLYSDAGTQFEPTGTPNPGGGGIPSGELPDIVLYNDLGNIQAYDSGYETGLADVFVGEREIRAAFTNVPASGDLARIFVSEQYDTLTYTNSAATDSILVANYGKRPDWSDVPTGGAPIADADATDLDLDLSVDVAFFIRVDSLDQDRDITFEVASGVDEVGAPITGTLTVAMLEVNVITDPPAYVFAPFTGFSNYGSLDFSDIDSISLIVSSSSALDMEISALGYFSPEPGSMALLGIGLAALARRRRRRRRR
ncbi:PEP-CTERM sorting domain-containing protein [bacterium]|nr:PEP-CTERM sorting domain-containing protein [bacterium]